MSCAPCMKRAQQQSKIVPIKPSTAPASNTSAKAQGELLRDKLRYTGR